MKYKRFNYIIWFFFIGIILWFADTVLDYYFFYTDSFWNLLIAKIPPHEFYIRIEIVIMMLITGIIVQILTRKIKSDFSRLKESENKFRKYIDFAPDGIFIADENGNYIDVNDAACHITGYSREELLSKNLIELIPEDRRDDAVQHFEKVVKFEKATGESQFIKKDGKLGIWTVDAVKLSETRFMGFVKEITEKQKIVDELKISEQNFKSLAENISEVFWMGSHNWQEVYYINQEYEKVWENTTDSLYKNPFSWVNNIVREDKRAVVDYIKSIRYSNLSNFEFPIYRIKTKDNKIKWIKTKGSRINDPDLNRSITVGIAEDITEFKKIEENLVQERDNARKYLQISGVIFIALDDEGNISMINNKAIEVLEYENETELIGKNWFQTCLPEEMRKEVLEVYKKILSGNLQAVEFYENPVLTKNGTQKTILWHNSELIDGSGKLIGLLSSGQDITERKSAEKELERRKQELEILVEDRMKEISDKNEKLHESQKALTFLLEDVNEARNEVQTTNNKLEIALKELEAFSYSVSHDLKAPLRAIDGFSQILLEDYKNTIDDEGKRYLKIVRENSQRMGELIQNLLDLSRVGRKTMTFEKVDFNIMIKEIFNAELQNTPNREINKKIKKLPEVIADKSLIRQVWQNYISNAIKFSSKTDNSRIEIGYTENEKEYEFYVKDNGVGFDMKYIDKLFNVFQRLHTVEVFEGTGVGLALAKRIVNKHMGNTRAEAKIDKGASFYFTLPKSK
ncbi:PAS domain S-box protein [Bacteroidota bacterium]